METLLVIGDSAHLGAVQLVREHRKQKFYINFCGTKSSSC